MYRLGRRGANPSAIIFFIFFTLFAVYSLVTMKGALSEAAVKYSIILLLSIGLIAYMDIDFFSLTPLTIPAVLLTIMAHYGSGAVASYIAYSSGMTTTSGTHSVALLWMHDTLTLSEAGDAVSVIGLALLNGVAEETFFTGAIYSGTSRFTRYKLTKAKYVAAFVSAFIFAVYHSQAYVGVTPMELLTNPSLWTGKTWLLLSPFVTQLIKCALFQQEAKRGGGLLGVSLGHAIGNGLLMLAALGGM